MEWLLFGSVWLVEVMFVLSIAALPDIADRRQETAS